MKRRNFVKTLASLAAVGSLPGVASAAVTGVSEPSSRPQGPAALTPRAAAAAHYALQIDGTDVGFVKSVDGGNAVSEIISEAAGKRLGKLRYEPLTVVLPVPPHAEINKLIAEAAAGSGGRRTVAIIAYDLNMKAVSGREFLNAVLSEAAIESLDASSKSAINIMLKFQPEAARSVEKDGAAAKIAARQKPATAFRFTLDGIDSTGIIGVDMPVLKRSVVAHASSDPRSPVVPGRAELSAFTVELSAAKAQPWLEWFEQFAVLRKDATERSAKLEIMSADLQTVLYTVSLGGVGIAALRAQKVEANNDAVGKLEATLYAERITYGS